MAWETRRRLGIASLVALLALGSTALAQTERRWVDPPGDGGTAPQAAPAATNPPPAPAVATTPPKPTPPAENTASSPDRAITPSAEPQKENARAETAVRAKNARVKARTARKVVNDRPARQVSRNAVTARQRSSVATADRIGSGRQRLVGRRLELMTLRTIEFPDGRRMDILVRPNGEPVREVVGDLY
jgi:hypothetical protein